MTEDDDPPVESEYVLPGCLKLAAILVIAAFMWCVIVAVAVAGSLAVRWWLDSTR